MWAVAGGSGGGSGGGGWRGGGRGGVGGVGAYRGMMVVGGVVRGGGRVSLTETRIVSHFFEK